MSKLKIGLSPRLLHQVPSSFGFKGKTLQYLEQSIAHWAMARGAIVFMLPTIETDSLVRRSDLQIEDYLDELDGLILQGGADVSPASYGEAPLRPEWGGDAVRDRFEIQLLHAFMAARKPVLGICRGMQLINVAFGGSLYQDILFQQASDASHADADAYDAWFHDIAVVAGTRLADLYPDVRIATVNSIHHQAVKSLGRELVVEATSANDGIVEALRWQGPSYVVGLQWHPEFHDPAMTRLLDGTPLLDEFLAEAHEHRR